MDDSFNTSFRRSNLGISKQRFARYISAQNIQFQKQYKVFLFKAYKRFLYLKSTSTTLLT